MLGGINPPPPSVIVTVRGIDTPAPVSAKQGTGKITNIANITNNNIVFISPPLYRVRQELPRLTHLIYGLNVAMNATEPVTVPVRPGRGHTLAYTNNGVVETGITTDHALASVVAVSWVAPSFKDVV